MAFEAPTLAAQNALLGGVAYLSVDGKRYLLVGDFNWSVSNVTRETQSGMDGVHGYTKKPGPGHVKARLRDSGGLAVADFRDMDNVTVLCELANGKTVTMTGGWTTEAIEVETEKGTFEVTWESGSVLEGLAG